MLSVLAPVRSVLRSAIDLVVAIITLGTSRASLRELC